MGLTFRDEKGAPLTHEELDANFRSFFFTASFSDNNLTLQRKDGTSINVPVGGQAFADFQANGGSIGDVFIADSQITGSRMIIDLFNGQFYDKTKAMNSDGGGLSSDEWYIDFDPSVTAPYYVHFGSNFAISSSGLLHASGARIEGDITASSGLIGGFSITPHSIHGPTFLGTPTFYISGAADLDDHFISASNFSLKGSGDITGSAVRFTGGSIAGWTISSTKLQKGDNIILDAANESISINSSTFGSQGIQLEYNEGTPRFYVGDGDSSFVKFDGTDVSVSTKLLEISASNIEISSTQASMSLGDGKVELLGAEGKITAGTTNKVRLVGDTNDAFLVAGTKTTFATNDAGIIIGMDSSVPTLDLTKDANNYVRFNTTSGVDIKTDTFKLDTTYFDIDTSTQRLNIFDTASAEIIRLGEISDDASDLFGLKIFDGSGTGSSNTIAMFGQQGNKVGGWEITDSQIRSIPSAGFGEQYGEDEVGLVIHSSGRLQTSNFATNLKGWRIDTLGNGSAEFENMRIRGTLKTTVFEKETVNVVGGQLMVTNASTIEALRDANGNIIAGSSSYAANAVTLSLANVSGFKEGEILKVKSVDDAGFSVEYMYVSGTKRYSEDENLSYNTGSIDPDGLAGEIYVERAFGGTPAVSSSIDTLVSTIVDTTSTTFEVNDTTQFTIQDIIKIDDERMKVVDKNSTDDTITVIRGYHDTAPDSHTIGDDIYLINTDLEFLSGLVSTAKPYNEGQVILSTGVYNPDEDISSGYILMNANPRDISTPYMDIVERTGSGVYDLQLRSRLGDLSGLSSGYLYGNNEPGFGLYTENGFFKGAITADTGSIAGILHVATTAGGLETGQKISIGRKVSGTTGAFNDGIFVNNNNYWYTDGAWKVGGSQNFISLDNFTDGNLTIKTETFTLDTSTFMISSSLNSGTLTAGTNANTITSGSGDGIYMDGTGKFRVGTATNGNNYIYWDGENLNIKGAIDITGGSGVNTDELNQATASAVSASEAFTSASDAALLSDVTETTDELDSRIFTNASGQAVRPPTASASGLYLASTNLGYYDDGEWKTYMDNSGNFFLTGSNNNKLAWDATNGTLVIKGAIDITGGNAATTQDVADSVATASNTLNDTITENSASGAQALSGATATLQDAVDAVDSLAAGKTTIFRQATEPTSTGRVIGDMWINTSNQNRVYIWIGGDTGFATSSDATYDQEDAYTDLVALTSASISLDTFTDSTGKIVRPPDTSSNGASGLFLGSSNLGFYSDGEWKTYMSDNGNFYLTGSGDNSLVWNGNSLEITGTINIKAGNAATTASVEQARQDAVATASISASNAAQTGVDAAESASNAAYTASTEYTDQASGSISASISASDSASAHLSHSISQSDAAFQGVLDGKNSVFRQATEPDSVGRIAGDMWIDVDDGNKVYIWIINPEDNEGSFISSSDTTFDQESLINDTSHSLSLDTFTDADGKIVRTPNPQGAGLHLGSSNIGFYDDGEWKTFMGSGGNFYLTGSETNYLKWDGNSLTIAGAINILGGNAATKDFANTAATGAYDSASSELTSASLSLSESAAEAQSTANTASGLAAQASQDANDALTRSVDAEGRINFQPTPSSNGQGLYQTSDRFGFYDSGTWKTYMSSSGDFYLSGDGNSGLSWDGSELSIDGGVTARTGSIGGIDLEAEKLYIGDGDYNNANTNFFVSSSGKFSLGDKLVWDGSSLTIEGDITVTNAQDFASQQELDNVQDELDGVVSKTSSLANPTVYSFGPIANLAARFAVDAVTPSESGLYLGSNNLGYYRATTGSNGVINGGAWMTYMDSAGNFYLTGSGDEGLQWNGTNGTLTIGNKGVGPTVTYLFSGSLDSNVFDASISTTNTRTSPIVGNTFNNNNNAHDEGFHTLAKFDRLDGPIFEWDVVAGDHNPATSFGVYEEAPNSFHRNQMHHSVYMHHTGQFRIYEDGSEVANQTALMGTTAAQWNSDTDFSENQQFRIRIRLLATGARYTVYKNGDYSNPLFVYDSVTNGITDRFVRPGVAIHYSSTTRNVLIAAMAAGAQLGNTTKISGNIVSTGKILSNNHSGTSDGSAFSSAGMAIDLDGNAISAKEFRISSYGDAVFGGVLSAASGSFGGTMTVGSGTSIFVAGATGVQLGNATFADAPFSVTPQGVLKATSGTIGGINLASNKLFIGTGNHNNNDTKFYVDNTGKFSLGKALSWNGSTLTISGSISIVGYATDSEASTLAGNAQTAAQNFATTASNNALTTAQTEISDLATSLLDLQKSSNNIEIVGRSLRKKSGTDNLWNEEVRTGISYTNGCELVFKVGNIASGRRVMIGIDSNPTQSTNYNYIDYLFYIDGTVADVRTNGSTTNVNDFSIANGDIFNIVYDGTAVKWYHNGVLKHSALTTGNRTFFMDSSFYDVTDNPIITWFDFKAAGISNGSTIDDGFVGGWEIDSDAIYSGTKNTSGDYNSSTGITLAATGSIHSREFFINSAGSASFQGIVQAAGITGSLIRGTNIEGGTITGGTLIGGALSIPDEDNALFSVDAEGIMSASDAYMEGNIQATAGQIGNWVIDEDTNALRDTNSKIVLEPNIPEIQMFDGGEKKVIISPLGELTSTEGAPEDVSIDAIGSTYSGWSSITSTGSRSTHTRYSSIPGLSISFSTVGTVLGPKDGDTFNAPSVGGYEITLDVPAFTVKVGTHTTPTGVVSTPNYTPSVVGQTHGNVALHRAYSAATLYLCAFNSSNTEVGSVELGSSYAYGAIDSYNYKVAVSTSNSSDDDLDHNFFKYALSVDGNSSVSLIDGSTKLAKDITKEDTLKVWDEDNSKFVGINPTEIGNREVQEHWEVEAGGNILKVTPDHNFWTDGAGIIKVEAINPGETQIYVDTGEGIEFITVTKRELIREPLQVYSYKVPKKVNYIANNIVNHNPIYGLEWGNALRSGTGASSSGQAAQSNKKVNLLINESGAIHFRYKWILAASSGRGQTTSANGTVTYQYKSHSIGASQSATFSSFSGNYDTPIEVAVPSNFVELKAGGLQIVSDADKFVRAPRLSGTLTNSETIFEVKGGIMKTDAIEASGNITAFVSSDERLKENIINLDGSLSKVLKLRGTRFDWKEGNDGVHSFEGNDIGFIAQEIKEVLPEVVGEMKGGYYGVKYEKLTPILVEAIKELSAKVADLEKKLESKN